MTENKFVLPKYSIRIILDLFFTFFKQPINVVLGIGLCLPHVAVIEKPVCVFVCRYGLKVITPEETFTLLALSPMDKVNIQSVNI